MRRPESLARVLMKGLAKAPNDRYQQCAEMMADLDRVRRTIQSTAQRVILAARERYRDILNVIEERRALGRAMGIPDIEARCEADAARLRARFPAFAPGGTPAGAAACRATGSLGGAGRARSAATAAQRRARRTGRDARAGDQAKIGVENAGRDRRVEDCRLLAQSFRRQRQVRPLTRVSHAGIDIEFTA